MIFALPVAAQAPAGPPRLEDPEARAAQEEGERAFNEGRYDEASAAFERAYAIEPAPFLLFTRAQVERLAERCDVAIELFTEYIDSGPSQKAASMALERIHLCGGEYAPREESTDEQVGAEAGERHETRPAAPPTAAVDPEGPAAGDEGPELDEPRRAPPRAWALVGSGGALLVGGAGLVIGSGLSASQAQRVFRETQAESLATTARALGIAGGVVASVGAALLVAGIVDAVTSRKRVASTAARP